MSIPLTGRGTSYTVKRLKIPYLCSNCPITSISSYVKNSGDQYKWGKQKNENSDKSHVLNNYIFYMILPLFRLCKWCHVTPSFPKKCIIYSNFQSFKLVVKLTWHKGNFLVFNIYCNHHVTRFSFFYVSKFSQEISQSAWLFWWCHDKIYLILPEGFVIFLWFPPLPPPPISSQLAGILLWSSLIFSWQWLIPQVVHHPRPQKNY